MSPILLSGVTAALDRLAARRPRVFGRGHLTAPGVILPIGAGLVASWLPLGVDLRRSPPSSSTIMCDSW